MNKIQFLVCNINTAFPSDINELIFKQVQENAAESIQRMYYFRVTVNLDALLVFNRISRRLGYQEFFIDEVNSINKIIAFYATRIRYSLIQEPGIWTNTMFDILCIYGSRKEFNSNNIRYITNNVKKSNEIYSQTGIEWWENY
mgnify:CR=1 FL=1|tara:strand:- start:1873 stop:2301 length:429 start_codon:yes stop_codon:yes gene_type:complete